MRAPDSSASTSTAATDGRFLRRRRKSTIGAALMMVGTSGIVAMGFLIVPGTALFHVSTAQYLLWYSIFTVSSAISMSVAGKLSQLIGIKAIVIMGAALATASTLGMAFATHISVFYLLSVSLGVGWGGSTLLAANIIVVGWHGQARRGTVLGAVVAGSNVGGILCGVIFPPVIAAAGFRGGMLLICAMLAVTMLLSGIFLVSDPPRRYLQSSSARIRYSTPAPPRYALVIGLLLLIAFVLSFTTPLSQILPAILGALWRDPSYAGLLVSYWAAVAVVIKPSMGWFHDRFGLLALLAVECGAFILGFGGMALAGGTFAVFIIIPLASLAVSSVSIVLPLVVTRSVGAERFAAVYGVVITAEFIGLASGTPLWGAVYDATGQYALALYCAAAIGIVGLTLMLVAVKTAGARLSHTGRDEAWLPVDVVAEPEQVTPTPGSAVADRPKRPLKSDSN